MGHGEKMYGTMADKRFLVLLLLVFSIFLPLVPFFKNCYRILEVLIKGAAQPQEHLHVIIHTIALSTARKFIYTLRKSEASLKKLHDAMSRCGVEMNDEISFR